MNDDDAFASAQRRLVGALIHDGTLVPSVLDIVKPEDIIEPSLVVVFSTLVSMSNAQEHVSMSSLICRLEEAGHLSEAGGIVTIDQLDNEGRDALIDGSIDMYARHVHDLAAKHVMHTYLSEAISSFTPDSGVSAAEAMTRVQQHINNVLSSALESHDVMDMSTIADTVIERLNERARVSEEHGEEGLQGIPCALPRINRDTSGWKPGQLIVVGARTGVGKSVFAVDSAVAAAQAGKSVMFCSLEMSAEELTDRFLAYLSGVTISALQDGRLDREQRQRLQDAMTQYESMNITVDATSTLSVDAITAKAVRAAHRPQGLDFLIIDYLQLVKANPLIRNRQEAVADMSRNIKLLAKKLGIPIMVLVQLNRASRDEPDDKVPSLDDIRESAAIAQDADVVLILYRRSTDTMAGDYNPRIPHTYVKIDKNRSGASGGYATCDSQLQYARLQEIDTSRRDDSGLPPMDEYRMDSADMVQQLRDFENDGMMDMDGDAEKEMQ